MQRDIDETQRAIAGWHDFDRAIEVLAAHVNPVKSRESNRKKALTIKDLLIKVSRVQDDIYHESILMHIPSRSRDSQDTSSFSATFAN